MNLLQIVKALAPQLAAAAQSEYDAWEVNEDGLDPEIGEGGICDRVADAMASVLTEHGIDTMEGGQEGDDHAFIYAYDDTDAVEVDIPPGVYETGGGYRWKKITGVTITAMDVMICPVRRSDIIGESMNPSCFMHLIEDWTPQLYGCVDPDFSIRCRFARNRHDTHGSLGLLRGVWRWRFNPSNGELFWWSLPSRTMQDGNIDNMGDLVAEVHHRILEKTGVPVTRTVLPK